MRTRAPRNLSSYLRLARPEDGSAGWRLVVAVVGGAVGFLAVTLLGLLVVAVAMAIGGRHLDVDPDHISPALLLATNLGLGLCIPLAGFLTAAIYQRQPRWLGSVAPGLRPRWFATCAAIGGVVWGVLLVLALAAAAASDSARLDGEVVAFIATVLVTTPFQAAGEEYLFRGFLLQSLGATGLGAPLCWVISGVVFATAHGQFSPPLFADRWLIGIVFAWLATSTGGLEASIALHAIKNITVFIPAAILGELTKTVDPEDVTWAPFVVDAIMLTIAAWWIRSRSKRQVLPPPPPDAWPPWSRQE